MNPLVSLRFALAHDGLLGRALPGPSWEAWRITAMAALGEPLTEFELATFRRLSGRFAAPSSPVSEMAAIVGRRGGKTRALSSIAVYIAALCDHAKQLVSGERGVVLLLSPNQKQSRIALDYCAGIVEESHELRSLVSNRTNDTLSLSNGVDIEVRAANFRQLRGVTCVAVLADETAFLADDSTGSANPDVEILNAVRPSLATTGGPLMIASSPYRKSGALWDIYRSHFGVDESDVLVVKGTSRDFNPCLDQNVVDKAMTRDPAAARAEYLGEFRDDLEGYISREVVDACIDFGVRERPPSSKYIYSAFIDPAGGSGRDAMTLAIAHVEGDKVIIDAIREARPPFSPDACTAEFAALLQAYRVREVTGDRFGGDWPGEAMKAHGIRYRLSDLTKSQIYIESLPRLNSGTIRLLDNDRLVSQLVQLERRHGRTSRDVIDHPPRGHDDLANVVAGVANIVSGKHATSCFIGIIGADMRIRTNNAEPRRRAWRRRLVDENGNEIASLSS